MPNEQDKLSHATSPSTEVPKSARENEKRRTPGAGRAMRLAWGGLVVIAAPILGFAALNTTPIAVALLAALPMLWALTLNRWAAGMAAGLFVAAAGWSVAPAVPNHFDDASLLMGIGAVALVGGVHAIVWLLAWAPGVGRGFSGVAAILVFALPPLVWVGWASPLNAAGVFLPGLGWFGLGVFLAGLLLVMMSRVVSALALTVLVMAVFWGGPEMPLADRVDPSDRDWLGVDTQLGKLDFTNARDVTQRQRDVFKSIDENRRSEPYVLLPETIVGEWKFAEPMWSAWESPGFGALVGTQIHRDTRGYHNSLVGVGRFAGLRYDQRFPIPWAMWNPLDPDAARADPSGPGAIQHEGQTIGVLICYEQLVAFPILTTLWERPDVIVAPSNAWWAANDAIPEMQRNIMQAWGRLFRVPVVTAINFSDSGTVPNAQKVGGGT
ncbi:conjugal transfer protein TraB [Thioalkalivibrio sp. ALE16]|uniref:conjugal transfer protein TraB n=1 Tax=Thioalkalivibrio sp. ALE16 TaxID=1158172 RepID=UPI0003A5EB8A|nr:conjugal transfer protein TraB [Thioalkalivibrio sp. ALE16]